MKTPTAILTADWHCMDGQPVCRTDDLIKTQIRKWQWLARLQEQYQCPILHAGDLLDVWKSSPWLLALLFTHLPHGIITIPGQHELPAHKMDRLEESGLWVLNQSGRVKVLSEGEIDLRGADGSNFLLCTFPWGRSIKPRSEPDKCLPAVAMAHTLTYAGKPPFPGAPPEGEALRLLKKFPEYQLILTGDNHEPFVISYKGRLLVNPGSLLRSEADQVEHQPRVYLWYADINIVKEVFVPIRTGVVSREHLDVKVQKEQRFAAYIERMKGVKRITIHFEDNLKKFFSINDQSKQVEELVWGWTEKQEK